MFGIADIVTYTIAASRAGALLNLKGLLFFPSMMVQLVGARYRKGGAVGKGGVGALFLAFAAKLWTA